MGMPGVSSPRRSSSGDRKVAGILAKVLANLFFREPVLFQRIFVLAMFPLRVARQVGGHPRLRFESEWLSKMVVELLYLTDGIAHERRILQIIDRIPAVTFLIG